MYNNDDDVAVDDVDVDDDDDDDDDEYNDDISNTIRDPLVTRVSCYAWHVPKI